MSLGIRRESRGDGRGRAKAAIRAVSLAAALLIACPISTASGQTAPFRAGITRLPVQGDAPFDTLIWYPTRAEEAPWQAGPFSIPASRDAAVATGPFPVVLLAHGGGVTGGSPLILRTLSAALARRGFVVIAPFHGKTGLAARVLQIHSALDAVLADPRFRSHLDPERLGLLGFSLGGAVALESVGAVASTAHLSAYCEVHPTDLMSCNNAPGGRAGLGDRPAGQASPPGPPPSHARLPVKAIALLDPLAVPFQRKELAGVTVPVLLVRPEQSELAGEPNAIGLAAALPTRPRYDVVPGGHFVFADVCEDFLRQAAPEVCRDPAGVDRAAVQAGLAAKIAEFFRESLPSR